MHLPVFPARQCGLTLVETIVAILIGASCVIGIAAIYTQQQNIARGGHLHARAIELTQQMAAHIREDSSKGNFETMLGATCTPQQDKPGNTTNMVACWQDTVEQELTNGSARISLDRNTVPAQYVIVVSWSEPRSGAASYVLRVTPGISGKTITPATTGPGAARAAG
ncbi:MAG: hypothetical protein AB7T07_09150 [Steroidobacteraceae bacterium]